jgi:hypothetical protein
MDLPEVLIPELPEAGLKLSVMRVEYSEAHRLKFLHVAERAQ